MSETKIKDAIANKKLICPQCKQAVTKYEKYTEMTANVWDGAGDSGIEYAGSKVTLVCGSCDWKERTEYWSNYIED